MAADRGLCSVEVTVTDKVDGFAQVNEAYSEQPDNVWIDGEQCHVASVLEQYQQPVTWGMLTRQPGSGVSVTIGLMMANQPMPVLLKFSNTPEGNATCTVTPEPRVAYSVTQVDTGRRSTRCST